MTPIDALLLYAALSAAACAAIISHAWWVERRCRRRPDALKIGRTANFKTSTKDHNPS